MMGTVFCLGLYILSTTYFPTSVYNDEQYMAEGMFHHIWYSFVATNMLATKYFFGFKLMQLPIHASGVSYKPS
jgi:hydrogenase/urease accessory protein HupE